MPATNNYIAPDLGKMRMSNHMLEKLVVVTMLAPSLNERLRKSVYLRCRDDLFTSGGASHLVFQAIQAHIKNTRRMPDLNVLSTDHRVRSRTREFLQQVNPEPARTKGQIDNAIESLESFRNKRALYDGFGGLVATLESDTYSEAEALHHVQTIVRKMSRPTGMSELDLSTDDPETRARVWEVIKRSQQIQARKFSTGWPTVDRILSGGLAPSELLLMAANTGGGKSMAALAMALHMVEHGSNVVYFSFEMREDAVFLRLAARWAGYTRAELASGKLSEQQLREAHTAFMTMLGNCPGTLRVLTPERGFVRPTLDYLEDQIHRKPTDVIFVDYMSMLGGNLGDRGSNEEQRLRAASEGLVLLGATTQTAVVAMAQLSAEGNLKYSRGVLDAATMLLQWDSTQAGDAGYYRVEIKKQRESAGKRVDHFYVSQNYDRLQIPEIEEPDEVKKQPSINDLAGM